MKGLRKKIFGSRRRKVVVSILALVLISSTALAGWLVVTGNGGGSAKVGQLIAPTVTASTSPEGNLYPDNNIDTGSLYLHISNPNSSTLYLNQFSANKANILGGTSQCDWGGAQVVAGQYTGVRQYLRWNGHVYGPGGDTVTFPGVFIDPFSIPAPPGESDVEIPAVLGLRDDTITECQGTTIEGFELSAIRFSTSSTP